MIELLTTYSLAEILTILVAFALSVKGLVSFFDWSAERLGKVFNKQTQKNKEKEELDKKLANVDKKIETLSKYLDRDYNEQKELMKKVNMLIDSDRDDIKSYITREHHYFCYNLKWIDDYSLDCVERRFKHYRDEGGNSFIEDLMNEIRALPKNPPNK